MTTAAERNAAVLAELQKAPNGLTPTEIAVRINQPWCCPFGACSAPVSPVLKRIGAVKLRRGVWGAPTPAKDQA
jgi:hypothetical protein